MSISLIAAAGRNNAIGRGGAMPWHISEDLKHFKRITSGHTVIMGRGTWESLGRRALPNRINIVISGSMPSTEACEVQRSLDFLRQYAGPDSEEVFIIGGGNLYRQTISLADRLYITEIDTEVSDADTFFPEIDPALWECADCSAPFTDEKSGLTLLFKLYRKR